MKIISQQKNFCVVHKDSGEHIHPPENRLIKVPRHKIILYKVRDALGKSVYPVHRLDAATEGLVIFAYDSDTARKFQELIKTQSIQKKYLALIRGWPAFEKKEPDQSTFFIPAAGIPETYEINLPLELDSTGELVACKSLIKSLGHIEIDEPVGKKFPKARYSFVELSPVTGRYHQLRRHLNRVSHPIIGDRQHGDSHHNRFVREKFNLEHLCLWSIELSFVLDEERFFFQMPRSERLESALRIFNLL